MSSKISALGTLAAVDIATGDLVVTVDVSDVSMAGTGTDKKTTVGDLITAVVALGTLATDAEVAAAVAGLTSTYQPLDSDLTAIAALATTTYGRALLTQADAAAARTSLGLGTAATTAATAYDTAGAAAAAQAASQPLDSDLTAIAALTTTSFGRSVLAAADAAALRTITGVGTIATQSSAAVTITGGAISGITDLAVADGGTGASTAAAARGNLGFYETGIADTNAMVWSATNSRYEPASVLSPSATFAQAQGVNAQTGTTYTLVAGDAGKLVTLSNAAAVTLTLPQDSAATIAIGVYVDLYQLGAGQVTVVAGSGATLQTGGATAKARAQYSSLGVQKIAANTFRLFGDLAAS